MRYTILIKSSVKSCEVVIGQLKCSVWRTLYGVLHSMSKEPQNLHRSVVWEQINDEDRINASHDEFLLR